jgi:ABC-type multidrug transport system fused ATPase/permease subunit
MADGLAPAPRERGWARLAFALAAFLLVPLFPAARAVFPVEHTLVLLVPTVAVCFLLGWLAGGRFSLALVWLAFAAWVVAQRAPASGAAYYDLARAWGLLLAGAFGAICILGRHGPFFNRALSAAGLALLIALGHIVGGRASLRRVERVLGDQYEQRNQQSTQALTMSLRGVVQGVPSMRDVMTDAVVDATLDQHAFELHRLSAGASPLFPALLALESLVVCALAWTLYHRLSRARIGPPLAPLRDFRFHDHLAWGLIVGLTLALLPAFGTLARIGQNLVLFFGMLYALRGLGVIDSFVRRSAVLVAIAAVIAIVNPRPYAAVVALAAILGLFAVLGVSDAWGDWRRRMRAVS